MPARKCEQRARSLVSKFEQESAPLPASRKRVRWRSPAGPCRALAASERSPSRTAGFRGEAGCDDQAAEHDRAAGILLAVFRHGLIQQPLCAEQLGALAKLAGQFLKCREQFGGRDLYLAQPGLEGEAAEAVGFAPLGWEHIALTGDYVWTTSDPTAPFRPLREVPNMLPALAA